MDRETIKNTINYKKDRIEILKSKQQKLIDLDTEVAVSKLTRSFRSAYFNVKRFIVLGLLSVFLITAIIALIYPNALFVNSESYKTALIQDFKDEYAALSQNTVDQSLSELQQNKTANRKKVEANLTTSIENTATNNIKAGIRLFALLLLLICLGLWYVLRLSKKVKERNMLLIKADKTSKEIIEDYNQIIEEEEREIKALTKDLAP